MGSPPRSSVDDKKADFQDDVDIGQVEIQSATPDAALQVLNTIDPVEERKLVRKFDFRILPVLTIMYLFNVLVCDMDPEDTVVDCR